MEAGKKKKLILCAAIGAVVLIAAFVIFLLNKDKIKASTMRLLRIVGEVTLEDGKKQKTIVDNLRLVDGNALSTATESLASVGLDDTKIISVEENSRAEFYQKGKKLELILTKGRLFFDVQKPLADNESLDIKSSTMVVGIRGTSGYVWEDPAKGIQYIYITDGHVKVDGYNPQTGNTEQVTIGPGQRATAYMNDDGTFNTFIVEDVTEEDLPIALIRELFNNPDTLERVLKATGYDKNKLIKRLMESDDSSYITLEGLELPEVEEEPEPEPVVEEEAEEPEPEPVVEVEPEPEPVKESVVETKTETTIVETAPTVVSEPDPEPQPEPTPEPEPEPAQQQTNTASQTTPAQTPAPTPHSISATGSDPDRGTASASPASAVAGDVVTLTATPNTNYEFVRWEVTSGSASIANTTSPNTSFTMTDSNVTINAVFQTKPGYYDSSTYEVNMGNGATAKYVNGYAIYLTKMDANGSVEIKPIKYVDESEVQFNRFGFEPGVLQAGNTVYYNRFDREGGRTTVMSPVDHDKDIDADITVVVMDDSYTAIASFVSPLHESFYSGGNCLWHSSDFTVTNSSQTYTFKYHNATNTWSYDYIDTNDNNTQKTLNLTHVSNANTYTLEFMDPADDQTIYYIRETDQNLFIPHR